MPPSLPREIIEKILQEENPSKPDLAKICLLNSSFLDFGRRLLYHCVQVSFFAQIEDDSEYDSEDCGSDLAPFIVRQRFDEQSFALINALDSKPALATLVKSLGFEQYDIGDNFVGRVSGYSWADSRSLMLNVLARFPNVEFLKLPSYIDGYSGIHAWYETLPNPQLKRLDARAVSSGAVDLLGSFQDVKHLSFTSKKFRHAITSPAFHKELNNLRLELLHIARPDKDLQNIFHCLTASSVSTLRTLRLPWHPQGSPSDISAFTSLASFELSHLSDVPSEQLVQTFATFPSSLVALSLVALSSTPFSDFDVVAQHIPSTVLSLEVPHLLDPADMIRIVDHLSSQSNVRFLSVEGFSGGRGRYAGVRAACAARGIAFSTFRRMEVS